MHFPQETSDVCHKKAANYAKGVKWGGEEAFGKAREHCKECE